MASIDTASGAGTSAAQGERDSIVFYSKTGCPWCNAVRHLFQEHGVPFQEMDVRADTEQLQALQRETGQDKTPTLKMGGEWMVDTDARQVAARLGLPEPADVKRAS